MISAERLLELNLMFDFFAQDARCIASSGLNSLSFELITN
jgi:hypothetical protein